MKLKKLEELKNAVLLVGSGYGSLKVAEDLAQSGIPVVWVTRSSHFLELPEGSDDFVELPEDLNYQFRPLYLRVTRHPLVTPLTSARVESIEQVDEKNKSMIVQDPLYIDYDLCTGCGKCMEVCPLNESEHPPLARTPSYCPSRALELDKRKISTCRLSCPLNVNVQAYVSMIAVGRFDEALAIIREDNPLPGICGRICHHPCEEMCRRKELEQPIAIRDLKRFLTDREFKDGILHLNKKKDITKRAEKIAIIGSGPSGLTAAFFLNQEGFPVTIFEALPDAGGMLRVGINAFRLSRDVLNAEIQAIVDLGVTLRTNVEIKSLDKLFESGFMAVVLCTGTHIDLRLKIPGEDLKGVLHCIKFLSSVNIDRGGEVGDNTVIVGGGNSAIDAARTALRLGAKEVTVLCIERENEMPAHPREIREAQEEGVKFITGAAPVSFEGDGHVSSIICRNAHWSNPESGGKPSLVFDSEDSFILKVDTVIVAIGQKPSDSGWGIDNQLICHSDGRVLVDDRSLTSMKGVFGSGDVVTGPTTVVDSMASGRKTAGHVIEYLTGMSVTNINADLGSRGVGDCLDILEEMPRQWRPEMAQRQPKVRRRDFKEVDCGFTEEQAIAEAKRCLQCGSCSECRACEDACIEIGAIDHFRLGKKLQVISPCVIVADESEMPDIILGEGDGIYHTCDISESINLMNLMVSGSSLAGQAMVKSTQLRDLTIPENRSFPQFYSEPTIGFFLCTCNGTMAPQGALNRIRDLVMKLPQVKYSELVFSVCHPLGADQIASAVKEHNFSKVILASCVCCPLEFQCISCNDQRTRARIHLFDRLGLDRSHFDMINLRDHLVIGNPSEDEIVDNALDKLRSAFIRVRFMKQLRQGITEIGNKILILGGSEIGISCALNLDSQGFRVRLVHRCRSSSENNFPDYVLNRKIDMNLGQSIEHVEEAVIKDIRGHVGDFTVGFKDNMKGSRKQVDIVCITDENLLSLIINEDMIGLKKFYRYNFAFFHTPQPGLYRVIPRTLERVSAFEAGNALAAQVARAAAETFLKDHELSPKIDPDRCRGCGRCADICPFNAIKMIPGPDGIYHSEIVRHNCVGCGGCVGRCPVTAIDMPYYSNQLLDEIVVGNIGRGVLK